MDFLKAQSDRIQQQLAGLTPSQKMLSFALVVIMAMTLLWFGKYAGSAEMVPLMSQNLSPDDLAQIDAHLTAAGIEHKTSADGRIMVPAEKQVAAVSSISFANKMPKSAGAGSFDDIIKMLTPWDGASRESAVFKHGNELALQRIISQYPGVESASVILATDTKRMLSGSGNVQPSASVTITTADHGVGTKEMAMACANLVAGAQSGLAKSRVTVVIGKKLWPMKEDGEVADSGMDAGNAMELQAAEERNITKKLDLLLNGDAFGGFRVAATVSIDTASESSTATVFDKSKSASIEQESTSSSNEQSTASQQGGEAGVIANLGGGASIGGAAAPQNTSTETKETTKNLAGLGNTVTNVKRQAGKATVVGAVVRVPQSYLNARAKMLNPAAKEVDAATLEKVKVEEFASIRKTVLGIVGAKAADNIAVDAYADASMMPQAEVPPVVASSSVGTIVTGHVKEIALGGLALASLFMMSMIVRKGSPAVPAPVVTASVSPAALLAAAAASAPTNRFESLDSYAGEAVGGNPTLDGMELDEDAIKSQQMLTQVTELVGENPEAAASLIKRWMNQR